MSDDSAPPLKDAQRAHPVARVWRPVFCDIVRAFVDGDFTAVIPDTDVIEAGTAKQIEGYLSAYGETLAPLPEETWTTSVAQWMGTHWDVLVDLWTAESGRSDLVLSASVFGVGEGFRFRIEGVFVP